MTKNNKLNEKQLKLQYLLIVLLAFSFESLSYDTEINNLENFYVKTNYFGAFFNNIGPLGGKEDAGNDITEKVFSFNKQGTIEAGYNPKYVPGFAGSAAIGYSLDNMRFELEGLYSQINLYDEDYSSKDKARYIELRRDEATSIGAECNSPWRSGKVDLDIREMCEIKVGFRAAFKMRNKGFNNLAGMLNVYYDFNTEKIPFTSYIGMGGGLTKVKFLGRNRYAPAYQAKLGINYPLATQTQIFAGLRYFGILGNQFKNIVPTVKIPPGEKYTPPKGDSEVDETARIESSTATITNRFGIYGLEFGLAYYF